MKNVSVQLCLIIFILLVTQTASAIPFTVERSFLSGSGKPTLIGPYYSTAVSWTFDLRPKGFDPDTYDIIRASLTLGLSDDGGWTKGDSKRTGMTEYALLDAGKDRFGPWEVESPFYMRAGEKSFALTKSLDDLSDYGTLRVTLRPTALGYGNFPDAIGDFALYSAKLTVEAEPTPVPEPATMFLLGTGLLGLAGYGRKKFFKK
jgi:hypothetical protein